MTIREESLGKVASANRIDVIQQVVTKRATGLGVGLRPRKPDAVKVAALMNKSKTAAEYFLVLRKDALRMEIRVAGTIIDLGSIDLGEEKDLAKRRAMLGRLLSATSLVTLSDLAAFDKAHPQPPDPKKLAELKKNVEVRVAELKLLRSNRDSKTYDYASYDGMDKASAGEFEEWAEKKGYDRYLMFIGSVDRPDPPGFVISKFLKKGSEYFVNLPPAITGAIERMNDKTGGAKVDMASARKEIMKKVDASMLAPYNTEMKTGLNRKIAALESQLKPLLDQLKAIGRG